MLEFKGMARFFDRLSYLRSLCLAAPLIFFVTGVMGTISLVSSLIDSSGRLQHGCARLWAWLVLGICGVKLRVTGNLPLSSDAPCVFFVNHQSHMDIPVILRALPISFRFAAKKDLFRIPFLGWHLRRSGHIPIDRRNPHAAVRSFRGATQKLRGGTSLVFFPEGHTSLDGAIQPFKAGGFVLATQSKAIVVPVTIRGSRKVLAPKTYHVRGGVVEVILGSAIIPSDLSPAELADRVRAEIDATFSNVTTLDRNTHSISR